MLNLLQKPYVVYDKREDQKLFLRIKTYIIDELDRKGFAYPVPSDAELKLFIATFVSDPYNRAQCDNVVSNIFQTRGDFIPHTKKCLGKDRPNYVLSSGVFKEDNSVSTMGIRRKKQY